jgi:hypothetical protein
MLISFTVLAPLLQHIFISHFALLTIFCPLFPYTIFQREICDFKEHLDYC